MKLKEINKVIYDDKQTVFSENGLINKKEITYNLNGIYSCSFCLFEGKFNEFLPTSKINLKVCPECKNRMWRSTILEKKTIKEFAEWVFNYAKSGFWEKCNFEVFNDRLYKRGLSKQFWDRYKELKGEYIEE